MKKTLILIFFAASVSGFSSNTLTNTNPPLSLANLPLNKITNQAILNFLQTNFPLLDLTQSNVLSSNHINIDENLVTQLIEDYLKKAKNGETNKDAKNKKETNNIYNSKLDFLETKNIVQRKPVEESKDQIDYLHWEVQLETAKKLRNQQETKKAAIMLVEILESCPDDELKKSALIELALSLQQENQLLKAYQIYAQFLSVYPDDSRTPEILLRQGLIIRNIGASTLALSKFYSVLSRALSLKLDQLSYYQRIVLQAQTEIADTYYILGKYEEAADFFQRLLRLDNQELNREHIQLKLIQSLSYISEHEKLIAQARDFITRFPNSSEQAEVRFRLAQSLKALGRMPEALKETLALLELSKKSPPADFQKWFYWQQRVGNEIANQLYKEGDYINALEIYQGLASIDTSASWQLPVLYQIGLVFERLKQPVMASQYYSKIISKENEVGTNNATALKIVIDMAKWRKEFLKWQTNAENIIVTSQMTGKIFTNAPNQTPQ